MIRFKNVTGINVEHNSSAPGVKASTDGVYRENDNQDNIGAGEWRPSNVGAAQSVKGSGNSAFLQKDQLCYLKRAEKLTFCIYFS